MFSYEDLSKLVDGSHPRPVDMVMINGSTVTGNAPDVDHVSDTLVVNGLHTFWDPIVQFCGELESEMHHPMTANSYLTPPNSRGFLPHWDTEPNLLLQTEGAKRWYLCPPLVKFPSSKRQRFSTTGITPEQRKTIRDSSPISMDLAAGETLFIPHGWIHWGETYDEPSLHVTLAWSVHTWASAIADMISQQGLDSERLREPLPPRWSNLDNGDMLREMTLRLESWLNTNNIVP
ncbi:JmjC domain-containing protein [Streptomyces sp. NPDC002917]|uniref:JmjC domain-containing protein n=1 Tax=Streptomyces sp. NPDC002917 TaxID=3364671 RepID=UPI003689A15C